MYPREWLGGAAIVELVHVISRMCVCVYAWLQTRVMHLRLSLCTLCLLLAWCGCSHVLHAFTPAPCGGTV